MRRIVSIEYVEKWVKDGKTHYKTYAILDNQEEAEGYGKDYDIGDKVEAWFDDKWDCYKMQKD